MFPFDLIKAEVPSLPTLSSYLRLLRANVKEADGDPGETGTFPVGMAATQT